MNGEIAAKSGWGKTELEGLDPFKKTSIEMGSYDHSRQYKGYYKFTLQTGISIWNGNGSKWNASIKIELLWSHNTLAALLEQYQR